MSYSLFEKMLLREADDGVTQPDTPPDFTTQQQQSQQQDQQHQEPQKEEVPEDQNNEVPPEERQEEKQVPEEDEEGLEAPAEEPNPEEELDQAEKEVFSELKPDQMKIKITELKKQYKKLHSVVTASLDKVNKASKNSYDSSMIDFIIRKLIELKDMVRDSLLKSFDTRTYIENQIELQRMIVSFNLIGNMIAEIKQSREIRQDTIENDISKNLFKPKKDNNMIFSRNISLI